MRWRQAAREPRPVIIAPESRCVGRCCTHSPWSREKPRCPLPSGQLRRTIWRRARTGCHNATGTMRSDSFTCATQSDSGSSSIMTPARSTPALAGEGLPRRRMDVYFLDLPMPRDEVRTGGGLYTILAKLPIRIGRLALGSATRFQVVPMLHRRSLHDCAGDVRRRVRDAVRHDQFGRASGAALGECLWFPLGHI